MRKQVPFSPVFHDAILRDEISLRENLTKRFGPLDIRQEWARVAGGYPVQELLRHLLPRSILPQQNWEKSRETTAEYLAYHFKYALLEDRVEMASSRDVVNRHLKGRLANLTSRGFDYIEGHAASLISAYIR